MLISQILGWLSVFICLMEAFRIVARLSKIKGVNRFFHKSHIPLGVGLLAVSGCHALLAGNFPEAAIGELEIAPLLFTVNWGTGCFICAVLLAGSYLLRKGLAGKWMLFHRGLTILMILMLSLHLADVGIHLPERWKASAALSKEEESSAIPYLKDAESTAPVISEKPTVQPDIKNTPAPTATAKPTPSPMPSQESSEEPESSLAEIEAGLPDGVYTGYGQGRNGSITVEVTVESGKIADIQVVGEAETPKYFSRAETVIDSILSAQSTEVDAITGATISSEGIKEAVADALRDL